MSKTSSLLLSALVAIAICPGLARADDDPNDAPEQTASRQEPASDEKAEAQALVKKAFEHVYEGEHALALAKFQRAHEVYPSPKILLNIGTTLKKLGRYAESATIYERYLGHPETDKSREAEVRRELADAVARVARLRIEVNVPGARVLVDGRAVELGESNTIRVDPGSHSVVAEKEGYEPRTASAFDVKAQETRTVRLGLVSHLEREKERATSEARAFEQGQAAAISAIQSQRIETARRFGASAGVAVAAQEPAASALVGLSYGVQTRFDVEATVVLGSEVGAYLGGRFFITTDRFRISVSAGFPAFFVDGANLGLRGGAGAGVLVTDHFGVTLDVGVEHYFSLPEELDATLFVPRLLLEARL